MKISHEIRDTAARQNDVAGVADPEAGMAEMSAKFRELGGQIDVALED